MYLQIIKILLAPALAFALCMATAAQDYQAIFEKEWIEAEKYTTGQKEIWKVVFSEFGLPAELAAAVVFPELLRYSALQNLMETAAVKALYLQGGTRGADFSIGRFQMKPSFAEALEHDWMQTPLRHEYEIYFDLDYNVYARRARIRRLDNPEWQCIYLALFLKLLYRRFPRLTDETATEQVRFCATAYNGSFRNSYEDIHSQAGRRFFHTDFIPTATTVYYSYSDIAVSYYKKQTGIDSGRPVGDFGNSGKQFPGFRGNRFPER